MSDVVERDAKRARILDEKRNVTGRISDTCRFIGFGLLAIFYTLRSGDSEFAKSLLEGQTALAVWVMGVCGASAIAADYFQYVCGSIAVNTALKRPTIDYDDKSIAYRGRVFFFRAKQWLVAIGALTMVGLVISA